jgi:hypothetical protein
MTQLEKDQIDLTIYRLITSPVQYNTLLTQFQARCGVSAQTVAQEQFDKIAADGSTPKAALDNAIGQLDKLLANLTKQHAALKKTATDVQTQLDAAKQAYAQWCK